MHTAPESGSHDAHVNRLINHALRCAGLSAIEDAYLGKRQHDLGLEAFFAQFPDDWLSIVPRQHNGVLGLLIEHAPFVDDRYVAARKEQPELQ